MFTITAALVQNAFDNLVARIPEYDREIALRFAMRLVGKPHTFPTASEAIGFISSEIWNSGYVR